MEPLTAELKSVALTLMEELDAPRSLTVAILIRNCEWEQLFKLECSVLHYADASSYYRAAQATSFLKKLSTQVASIDAEGQTLQKWWDAEKANFCTNRRLYELLDFGTLNGHPAPEALLGFLRDLRKNFVWLCGSRPPSVFDGRFGPGATMSDPSRRCNVADKIASIPTLTPGALPFMFPWTGTYWAAATAASGSTPLVIRGNAYFTVPKTALVRRPCAKEPSLNAYYQLGLGRVLRDRLKKRGLDLDDGQDVHRRAACAASNSGEFCTIDLSSASDTVSRSLVRIAAPDSWHEVLDSLRSPFTKVDGKWIRLEKFSSMGNGFTFELETALFAALCLTLDPTLEPGKTLLVYGDDIIVPTALANEVIAAFAFFGLTTNVQKTFTQGPFRESCGGDYWLGQAVRPYYQKELPNEPQQLVTLANGLNRIRENLCRLDSNVRAPLRSWHRVLDLLPSFVRQCRGPSGLGDTVIHDEETRWHFRWRKGIRWIRSYHPVNALGRELGSYTPETQFAYALYGASPIERDTPRGERTQFVSNRDSVVGYRVGWSAYS